MSFGQHYLCNGITKSADIRDLSRIHDFPRISSFARLVLCFLAVDERHNLAGRNCRSNVTEVFAFLLIRFEIVLIGNRTWLQVIAA